MDKIIIIDDSGIQKELESFLIANKEHIRLNSNMDEISLGHNPVLKEIVKQYEEKHKVKIQSKDHVRFYKQNEIIYLKSNENKTILYQSDHSKTSVNENIDAIEQQLKNFPFLRTHHDYIVNLHHIVKISGQDMDLIILTNGNTLPVTEIKKAIIIEFLNKYI